MDFENSIWDYSDFEFKDNTLIQFSNKGFERAKINKDLVLPGYTNIGRDLEIINTGAFWGCKLNNVDFTNCRKLKIIDTRAFGFNNIESLNFASCGNLKNKKRGFYF